MKAAGKSSGVGPIRQTRQTKRGAVFLQARIIREQLCFSPVRYRELGPIFKDVLRLFTGGVEMTGLRINDRKIDVAKSFDLLTIFCKCRYCLIVVSGEPKREAKNARIPPRIMRVLGDCLSCDPDRLFDLAGE